MATSALSVRLLDHVAQVGERARRRGFDVAAYYRHALMEPGAVPRVVAACLGGLAVVGDESDLATYVAHLNHASVRVRAAAVSAVLSRGRPDEIVELLTPLLLDPSARVSMAAARGLARLGVPPSTADVAWATQRPDRRENRAGGGT